MSALANLFKKLKNIINNNIYKGARPHAKDKDVGRATQKRRAEILRLVFKELYTLGFRLRDPKNLSEKHIQALVNHWVENNKSPKTIQGRLSTLRIFAGWINKPGMVKSAEHYVDDPNRVKCHTVTRTDKTWTGKGMDIMKKIKEVMDYDIHVGTQLLLAYMFGLRSQEAWMLRPHLAHSEPWLLITRGAKGNRNREIAIRHDYQREALEFAKCVAEQEGRSMVPPDFSIKRWKDHYYKVLRKFQIGRNFGVVAHGLRHERLNQTFFDITGCWLSIKGGKPEDIEPELYDAAVEEVTEDAGHSRKDIIGAYGGPTFRFLMASRKNTLKQKRKRRTRKNNMS